MIKRIVVLGFLWLACITAIHGAGRKENESHSADTPEGFTDSIPIESKKTGKWNFFMEAFDKGGNSTRFGPYNIYNDPVSDLPVVTIINPKVNMHVQGNVSIVGICSDDDGVDHVELVVTRGPGEKGEEIIRARASGGAFWMYYLDTTDEEEWPDGVYTITAWGIDINGLSGVSEDFRARDHKKHSVYWNLDRKKPKTRIASHDMGALVAGKINLRGAVYDGNGVNSLSYSLDGGNRYSPISLKHDKKTNISSWSLSVDTKKLEEGPNVVWLRSHDGMGTMGLDAHLLFVNNTSPDVQILYPDASASVGGLFSVAVYAAHPVGMKSLTWKLGKDQGEIPLIIGNSWYTQEFDIRGLKATSIDLEIRAEDLTGNVTVAKRKMAVDQNATMPVVKLESPAANTRVDSVGIGGMAIKGVARTGNGDPIASVLYSVDSGPATEVPSAGNFQIMATDLTPGTHTVDVWAKSIVGVEGPKVTVRGVVVSGALPEPRLTAVRLGTGRNQDLQEFYTGMEIVSDARSTVEVTITAAASISNATISFAGMPPVAVNARADREGGGVSRAEVPLPANLPAGLIEIELRATDRNGSEGVYVEYIYIGARTPEFRWVRANRNASGQIMFSSAGETLLALTGSAVTVMRLTGTGSENVRAEVDAYGRIQLTALAEGEFGPLTLNINSGSQSSGEFRVLADFGGPTVAIQPPPRWVQNSVPVQFTVADANGFASVECSLDLGNTWTHLLNSGEIAALRARSFANFIERTLDVSPFDDGTVTILIRATDKANNVTFANVITQKDNEAPQPQLIMPIADANVNGTIRLAIGVEEAGTLSQVSYLQGANRRQVYVAPESTEGYAIPRFFDVLLDFVEMPLRDNMRFVFEDAAGNSSELNAWPFVIDNQMDIPVAHITLPLEGETLTADFEVSGVMFDDDAIKQVYWRIDNNAEQTLETGNGFSIPIFLSSLTDNEHKVTITAEDIYGVKSEPVTRNFRVSLSEPIAVVTAPAFDILAAGLIEMSGGAYDDNGIEKIQVSLDSGNSFSDARLNAYGGTAEWFFTFNTVILPDGPNVVFMRATDKYGIAALYASLLNVDNTLPVITLDSPVDGATTTGKINILGQIVDVNMEEKNIQLRSLEGRPIPQGFKLSRIGPTPMLQEAFDLSSLRDGLYNIEIRATDKAGNETSMSRNIVLSRESKTNSVDILYPLNGEYVQGNVNLYGNTGGSDKAETVTLRINGADVATTEVTWTGYYCFPLNEEFLQNGENQIVVHSDFGTDNLVLSPVRTLYYQSAGSWVTIDSLTMGDFAFDRPWFVGRAGYTLTEEENEIIAAGSKNADKEVWDAITAKTVDYIDMSFDNGNTFVRTKRGRDKNSDWSYRLETGEMKEGLHYIIVRARMKNGELAVSRSVLQVDKTPPRIRVIAPEPGGHYNTDLEYTAIASDDVALADLQYHLRIGDRAAYEVPGFLQGLYFESVIPPFIRQVANGAPPIFAGGATYMDVGMGLSFFDDNVKIQVQYGFMFQEQYEALGYMDSRSGQIAQVRYGGHVFGIKLLANVYTYPFAAAFGPDFEWLFGSIALGANFSLFDVGNTVNDQFKNADGSPATYTQSGQSTWMSALLLQLELPKVSIPKRKYLRTFSMFTEGQLWFVPTDVDAEALGIETVIPHIIMGLRLYIF
jgi:hypothetical protein